VFDGDESLCIHRKGSQTSVDKIFSECLYCHLKIPLFSLLLCIKDYVNQEAETLLVRLIPPQCITSLYSVMEGVLEENSLEVALLPGIF